MIYALLEAWNTHDIERVVSFYTPEYYGVDIGRARPQSGIADLRDMVQSYWIAFPDLRVIGKEMIVERDQIALVWLAQGTHQGSLLHIPPTGRRVEVYGASILTLQGDKIARAFYIWDLAGLLRSLGLLPEL